MDKVTPIVFFSGKAFEAGREAALMAGADAHVVKPGTDLLVPTVRRLLERGRGLEGRFKRKGAGRCWAAFRGLVRPHDDWSL